MRFAHKGVALYRRLPSSDTQYYERETLIMRLPSAGFGPLVAGYCTLEISRLLSSPIMCPSGWPLILH